MKIKLSSWSDTNNIFPTHIFFEILTYLCESTCWRNRIPITNWIEQTTCTWHKFLQNPLYYMFRRVFDIMSETNVSGFTEICERNRKYLSHLTSRWQLFNLSDLIYLVLDSFDLKYFRDTWTISGQYSRNLCIISLKNSGNSSEFFVICK